MTDSSSPSKFHGGVGICTLVLQSTQSHQSTTVYHTGVVVGAYFQVTVHRIAVLVTKEKINKSGIHKWKYNSMALFEAIKIGY